MRYQMVLRILKRFQVAWVILPGGGRQTHEAKGVTPIPAPTNKTVSNLAKSSLALPKGPSTITRGRVTLSGGLVLVPMTLPPAASFLSPLPLSLEKLQPQALAKAVVKSPLTEMCTDR